ncbi:hypothetical protein HH310_31610 [Actinoplanes sp. TBRC 11911]|uniref:tautomerase family protein n=1 Tax=Actinoplanes sp. TBRC 11911 TaxID=2729386 RepID=UPI00145D04F1|nr:tautomerase family protein [Actinoplanes sp. TBRC 11911]NMO55717.1 hypothetical protein [Actinoplanes sp. TBRC 11911]
MPFVDISLARGKSADYLRAVSGAVRDALIAELSMQPEDDFQLIHQLAPEEMVFSREFRGGPRSDDWIVFKITEGIDRGAAAKRRFYQTLVRLLEQGPKVRPADVFVMFTLTPAQNFSFADGAFGPDVAAAEALDADAKNGGRAASFTRPEMVYALERLFAHRDLAPILPMLRADIVLKMPASLPWGGEFVGVEPFTTHLAGVPGGGKAFASFDIRVEQIIESADHLIVPLVNTAVTKADGKTVVFENLWVFGTAGGRFVSAQLYADTAAVTA